MLFTVALSLSHSRNTAPTPPTPTTPHRGFACGLVVITSGRGKPDSCSLDNGRLWGGKVECALVWSLRDFRRVLPLLKLIGTEWLACAGRGHCAQYDAVAATHTRTHTQMCGYQTQSIARIQMGIVCLFVCCSGITRGRIGIKCRSHRTEGSRGRFVRFAITHTHFPGNCIFYGSGSV